MTIQLKKSLIGAALAAACLIAPQAQASFAVSVNGNVCADNTACDSDPTAGQIAFLGSVAGLTFTLIGSVSNSPGGPTFSLLDMGWLLTAGGAPVAVQLLASSTGFTYPTTGSASILSNQLNGNFSGGGGTLVLGQSWVDSTNSLFGMSGVTAGSQGLNTNTSIAFIASTPYSITQELDFTLNARGTTSGDFASQVVPEPAPLALIGIALAALGFARRREKNSL